MRQAYNVGNFGSDGFVFTVDTTQAGSASDTFVVPTASGATYNCTVYWGDGSSDAISTYDDAAWTHQYPSGGTYQITIEGQFGRIYFNNTGDKAKVTSIQQLGAVGWESMSLAFYGCANLSSIDSPVFDGSAVTDFLACFYGCSSLTAIPSGLFDHNTAATNFQSCFDGVTLTTSSYSALLVSMEANLSQTATFHGGNSKYNASGETARNALINDHSWTFTDGGLET